MKVLSIILVSVFIGATQTYAQNCPCNPSSPSGQESFYSCSINTFVSRLRNLDARDYGADNIISGMFGGNPPVMNHNCEGSMSRTQKMSIINSIISQTGISRREAQSLVSCELSVLVRVKSDMNYDSRIAACGGDGTCRFQVETELNQQFGSRKAQLRRSLCNL